MNLQLKYISLDYLESSINNKDFIIKILDVFIEELPKIEKRMKGALKDSNYEELSEIAHKAKSSVAILGMNNEKEEMRKLEFDALSSENINSYEERVNSFLINCQGALEDIEKIKKAFS